jgi:2EXR family
MSKASAIVLHSPTQFQNDSNASQAPTIQNHNQPRTASKPHTKSLRKTITNKFNKYFHQFSDFPVEIRFLIWEYALPDGRVHELHPCTKLLENGKMMFRSNHSSPPALLSVSQESRKTALQHYCLMTYDAPFGTKGIRKFYFSPVRDTLFLNTLLGLYMAFMLLETNPTEIESPLGPGEMTGWQNVALDADRAHLLDLLAGHHGHSTSPRLKAIFPNMKKFTIAFDFTKKGKTRFRTSVWPGENGTSLKVLEGNTRCLENLFEPILQFTRAQYGAGSWASETGHVDEDNDGETVLKLELANVRRKRFWRGDVRYGFRKCCALLRIRPPGIFMRF